MSAPDPLRIALTGDSIVTRRISVYNDEPTRALLEMVRRADVSFTNLEVLPNDFKGDPAVESGGSHLAAEAWVLDDLLTAGFDLFACANNHSLDYSISGLVEMIKQLEKRDIAYAGVGHNLGTARMPVYVDHANGSVAMLACSASFATGQEAGEQRPDMQGRPGLNPMRFDEVYEITSEQMSTLQSIATDLGLEQQRLDKIQLGFGFPPDSPDIFPFLDAKFRVAEKTAIKTSAKKEDLDAYGKWTREATNRADIVIASIHAHEQGATKEEPADFIREFAFHAIDQGADIVVGHGPHLLRGMEFYKGRPIFYSLGNFVGQNELVHKVPADSYERFRVDPGETPGEMYRIRTQNDTKSFPADRRYWETIMPICEFQDRRLVNLELVPVTLGYGQRAYQRGRPRLATGVEADDILARFAELSRAYGTQFCSPTHVELPTASSEMATDKIVAV